MVNSRRCGPWNTHLQTEPSVSELMNDDIVQEKDNVYFTCTFCKLLLCKELAYRIFKNERAVCWQGNDQPSWSPSSSTARKPRSPLTLCQFAQILIDWTGSSILGHFVKAVKFIGIQKAGGQSGDGAYFVVLIESWSPSLQAALNRREALGESITITCPLVVLFHSTSPNLTAWHELFTTLSVQYTQPPLTDCSEHCLVFGIMKE